MKEYLEDRKIDKKYIRFNQILFGITITLIMIMIFVVGSLIQYKEYIDWEELCESKRHCVYGILRRRTSYL